MLNLFELTATSNRFIGWYIQYFEHPGFVATDEVSSSFFLLFLQQHNANKKPAKRRQTQIHISASAAIVNLTRVYQAIWVARFQGRFHVARWTLPHRRFPSPTIASWFLGPTVLGKNWDQSSTKTPATSYFAPMHLHSETFEPLCCVRAGPRGGSACVRAVSTPRPRAGGRSAIPASFLFSHTIQFILEPRNQSDGRRLLFFFPIGLPSPRD